MILPIVQGQLCWTVYRHKLFNRPSLVGCVQPKAVAQSRSFYDNILPYTLLLRSMRVGDLPWGLNVDCLGNSDLDSCLKLTFGFFSL
jgi:hypothetical protein